MATNDITFSGIRKRKNRQQHNEINSLLNFDSDDSLENIFVNDRHADPHKFLVNEQGQGQYQDFDEHEILHNTSIETDSNFNSSDSDSDSDYFGNNGKF